MFTGQFLYEVMNDVHETTLKNQDWRTSSLEKIKSGTNRKKAEKNSIHE